MAKKAKTFNYVSENGLKITLKPVKQLLLQRALNSTKFPDPPQYETTTLSGRVELHPMDEESAMQTEGGIQKWNSYIEARNAAETEQNDKVLRTILLTGTEVDVPEDNEWLIEMELIGLDPSPGVGGRKIDYLYSQLESSDLERILVEVMKLSGASEEVIKDTEDSFSDPVRNES